MVDIKMNLYIVPIEYGKVTGILWKLAQVSNFSQTNKFKFCRVWTILILSGYFLTQSERYTQTRVTRETEIFTDHAVLSPSTFYFASFSIELLKKCWEWTRGKKQWVVIFPSSLTGILMGMGNIPRNSCLKRPIHPSVSGTILRWNKIPWHDHTFTTTIVNLF